ncbi:unnamed protein product [Vitrella brassicaformis CCMP3155]|uniref:Fe2OG dioxygenase domain-containing protein n=2 Tax=Vitrella brassicaformis TaxID=1169539 RepID=A0A0G4EPK3_VITBC|nr:unnamed protein product [Vitrella brassicaformis CCMP3155]|eukprot:CEL99397.1 unnamed protein product [Vitrella brassicaformis CCMP3155]
MDGKVEVEWDEETVDKMVAVLRSTLDHRAMLDLERRARSGTGTEEKGRHHHHHCHDDAADEDDASDDEGHHGHDHQHHHHQHHHHHHHHTCKKGPDDGVGQLLDEVCGDDGLRDMVVLVMERTAEIFENVRRKAAQEEGAVMDEETAIGVQKEILKEALIRQILQTVNAKIRSAQSLESREGGLLATPGGYRGSDLDRLRSETIHSLMRTGFAVQDGFMGGQEYTEVYREVEMLEYASTFNQVYQQQLSGTRSDDMGWFSFADIDRIQHKHLWGVFEVLSSLPFELNKKANLYLQMSSTFQLACYHAKGTFYKRHIDGGYDAKTNNGRKITAIYYPNPQDWTESDGGALRIYGPRRNPYGRSKGGSTPPDGDGSEADDDTPAIQDILPKGDRLVLFRSRDMPHEVLLCHRKRFAVSLWLPGPPGPGDDWQT